jgi:hypothetical protein
MTTRTLVFQAQNQFSCFVVVKCAFVSLRYKSVGISVTTSRFFSYGVLATDLDLPFFLTAELGSSLDISSPGQNTLVARTAILHHVQAQTSSD